MQRRIMFALLLAAALAGCSAIKVGYNSLPNLAFWWLDNYLDFNDAQDERVREDLRRLHAWHRHEELPRAAEMLARAEQLAPGPISAAQACGFVAQVQGHLNTLADRAEPTVVGIAMSLGPAQVKHLERKYAGNNADYRREWIAIGAQERVEKRYEQMLERLEGFYGKLDAPQQAVLREVIARSVHDPARLLAERQRRQQDLLAVLRRIHAGPLPEPQARALLRAYLERTQAPPDAATRQYLEALRDEGCRSFAAVHEATTPAQRESAVRRLRAYQRDLLELAAQQ